MKVHKQQQRGRLISSKAATAAAVAAVACSAIVTTTQATSTKLTNLEQSTSLHAINPILQKQVIGVRGGGESDGADNENDKKIAKDIGQDLGNADGKKKKKKTKKKQKPKQTESNKTGKSKQKDKETSTNKKTSTRESSTSTPEIPPEITTILSSTCYYAILNIPKSASSIQIKKAYRARALLSHPDKLPNSDRRAFDKVSEAYDVLSNVEKRGIYDRFGMEGLKNGVGNGPGGAGGSFQEEILKSFFGHSFRQFPHSQHFGGFGGGRPQPPTPPRNRNLRYQLEVSLEDLYNGKSQDIILNSPSPSGAQKSVHVSIPRGYQSGESIKLHGEVDTIPNATPGDVILILSQKKHEIFSRRGDDLAMEVRLSLKEALCGFTKDVVHLDGRTFTIGSPKVPTVKKYVEKVGDAETINKEIQSVEKENDMPPVIIKTGDVHVLKGEGMPRKSYSHHSHRNKEHYGDLYIQYLVEMPSSFSSILSQKMGRHNEENLTSEERETLAYLLDKLERGKYAKRSDDKKSLNSIDAFGETESEKEERNTKDREEVQVQYLQVSSASEFGQSRRDDDNNHPYHDGEEHLHESDNDDDDHYQDNPFGGFFHPNHPFMGERRRGPPPRQGGPGPGFHYFSSSNGFGGASFYSSSNRNSEEDDGSNVQCQQM